MKFEIYRETGRFYDITSTSDFARRVVPMPGDWRWRLKSSGRIVAEGGEGYQRRAKLLSALRSIFRDSPRRLQEIDQAERVALKAAGIVR